MARSRVMLVDDSPAMRQLVAEVVASDPSLELVTQAGNGAIALQRVASQRPDLITLDVDMPVMNGLAFLRELRRHANPPHVIMFSSHTLSGARVALEALEAGAADFVTKPAGSLDRAAALEHVRRELLPRIHAILAGLPAAAHDEHPGASTLGSPPPSARPPGPRPHASEPPATMLRHPGAQAGSAPARTRPAPATVRLVAIAASTGGPPAVERVLTGLPADFPVPVVVVQHMPPLFTAPLAERLDGLCALDVREATHGERLERGQVRIAPGGFHMQIANRVTHRVELHEGPMVNGVRPSADVLLHSMAHHLGAGVLAVVLTGMGHDGLDGCRAIRAAGGQVLVQDRATSVVWGMPRAVAEAGLADDVLPLGSIAAAILERTRRAR